MSEPRVESCRSCGARIYWALTEHARRPMPIDVEPVSNGNLVLTMRGGELVSEKFVELKHPGRRRFKSHFATCKQAAEWRRPEPSSRDVDQVQREAMQTEARRSKR